MDDLKQALLNELKHVTTIFFDDLGNWFVNNHKNVLESKSRDEILKTTKKVKTLEPTAE
jgi:hypothetical protein